nr:MAG TPA: hypothetical protein [Caudoviricetes sp.]
MTFYKTNDTIDTERSGNEYSHTPGQTITSVSMIQRLFVFLDKI